jgi:hypothetical protein
MSEHILKRHSKTLLLYHIVCPAKYRRKVFTQDVENTLKIGQIFILDMGLRVTYEKAHFWLKRLHNAYPHAR